MSFLKQKITMTQSLFNHIVNTAAQDTHSYLTPKLKCIDIFNDKDSYLNNAKLFYAYFNKVPNLKSINNLDCSRIRKWMTTQQFYSIIHTHTNEQYSRLKKRMTFKNIIYVLNKELLLTLEKDNAEVVYASGNGYLAQELLDRLKCFTKKTKRTTDINMIVSGNYHLSTIPVKIKKPMLNISTHYNDDLITLHDDIVSNLKKKKTKGLFLFHGMPGTGKSTYIRYLIHQLKKKVIFMSPTQAAGLESPQFSLFLIENSNSILIIEDAEELIVSRDGKRISSISTLLNLSDGLLAESLGIQVIATFNTNIQNIDKALLRKGRLTALYEFKELSTGKTNALISALGFKNFNTAKPMSLADIYNIEEPSFQITPERSAIGFITSKH
jgi:dephospho-CoA kinase